MKGFLWTVPGVVIRVVDGDTVRLLLDLGWGIGIEKNARVIGINAPELRTPQGPAAKAFAESLLPPGREIRFISHQLDKYGRPLGEIKIDGQDFATAMLNAGHAKTLTY